MFKKLRKNLKNYKIYKSILKDISEELEEKYNVRIDNFNNMYSVYSISPSEYNAYGANQIIYDDMNKNVPSMDSLNINDFVKKVNPSNALKNGDDMFEEYIIKKTKELDRFLISKGLTELYGISTKKRLDDYNYLVVIRFKGFDVRKINLRIVYASSILFISTISSVILYILQWLF